MQFIIKKLKDTKLLNGFFYMYIQNQDNISSFIMIFNSVFTFPEYKQISLFKLDLSKIKGNL